MEPLDMFKNLVVMAAADRAFAQEEIDFLSARAHALGLTDDDFRAVLDFAISGDATIDLPVAEEDRLELLRELIRMMAADGVLAEQEKELFASVAAKMDIGEARLNELIDSVL